MIKIFLKLSTHDVQKNFYFIFLYREKKNTVTRETISAEERLITTLKYLVTE